VYITEVGQYLVSVSDELLVAIQSLQASFEAYNYQFEKKSE